jgi:heme-degrading monooxygenase HmoA
MNVEPKKFVLITVFTPKPGRLDEFLELHATALPLLHQGTQRPRGGRLYRAEDGSKALQLSVFDTADDFYRFVKSEALIAHRRKLSALLHGNEPTRYELIYEAGDV